MSATATRALAFFRLGARRYTARPWGAFFDGSSIVVTVLLAYFLGRLVDRAGAGHGTPELSHGYFSFAVVGTALSSFLMVGSQGFASPIREGQLSGTLEPMLATAARPSEIVLYGATWSFALQTVRLLLQIALAGALGLPLGHASFPAFALSLVLAAGALAPLGVLGATFVVLTKRGNPVWYFVATASTLLGGVTYPVSVLPSWLRPLCDLIPLKHANDAVRAALLRGETRWSSIAALAAFAVVLGPASLWAFERAVLRERRKGMVGGY